MVSNANSDDQIFVTSVWILFVINTTSRETNTCYGIIDRDLQSHFVDARFLLLLFLVWYILLVYS